MSVEVFKERRKKVLSQMKENEILILASHPVFYRQHDVPHPYRQDNFFYYLTGLEEQDSYLVLGKENPSCLLFVRGHSAHEEIWESRLGPQEAQKQVGADECLPLEKFDDYIKNLSSKITHIYRISSINKDFDRKLESLCIMEKTKTPGNFSQIQFLNARKMLSEMRMIKSPKEIEWMKKACWLAEQGHKAVMKMARPNINERQLHGEFIGTIMKNGSKRESYNGIFASGKNALVLHYTNNDQLCSDGDLMLVDAGAEWEYYASDVTRVFPINGKFSEAQKTLYNHLLSVQKRVIEMIRPGLSFRRIQNQTREWIFECLKKENILGADSVPLDVDRFFPHNFGHLIGLDVHDVGVLKNDEKAYRLEQGMVITVEPGIYIPVNCKDVPEKFRGIGLRIEDNIYVTENGFENLTQRIPKEVDEIEKLMSL